MKKLLSMLIIAMRLHVVLTRLMIVQKFMLAIFNRSIGINGQIASLVPGLTLRHMRKVTEYT